MLWVGEDWDGNVLVSKIHSEKNEAESEGVEKTIRKSSGGIILDGKKPGKT